ncbi:2-C-methyl-D-erythritol 4-phosphate cytidylyltransferase [Plantibacter sp. YIM 135249]|uniref:2-C-methyl-D-erythritol 4-phosphate cytidylyltransferase n=1 Tax=Plantibacter sp. YIM 135249 TaxID=3423918 RepID=UPI003D355615
MSELPEPTVGVIVVAAGSGTRLGAGIAKAFVGLGSSTILETSLDGVFGMAEPAQVVLVVPADRVGEAQTIARGAAGRALDYVSVVAGGDSRQESVSRGLAALWPSVETVLVHDAARALTPSTLFDAVVAFVRSTGWGAVPGLAVADTIKRVDAEGLVQETVDRSALAAVQTPQGFPRASLVEAYRRADREYTDDAALYAAAGHQVATVAGEATAFKITTPWDAERAEQVVAKRAAPEAIETRAPRSALFDIRTGIGIDVHAFADDAPLWLAGLSWPDQPGLSGHSDGDPVAHAIVDALLSAAGLGDIGTVFGTADPEFAGAHGDVFLRACITRLADAGFAPINVAVQLVGNKPRFSSRRAEAEALLSGLVGAPVSVAATTSDALGFTGRGEGVTAVATALVRAV